MAFTLIQAHGISMILAMMLFCSTGVLFARYGRAIRFGNRRQFLGKAVWFQIHRFLLSITAVLTLLGFFFTLVRSAGKWVDPQVSPIRFAHSVFGGIIVCCTMVQVYLALYRCNPRSRYRYIFDWSHRITGFLVFGLSIPTMLLIVYQFIKNHIPLLSIVSIWSGWIVTAIIIFERIEYKQRRAVTPIIINERTDDKNQNNSPQDTESGNLANVGGQYLNFIKLIVLLLHIFISIVLSISFIVIFCS